MNNILVFDLGGTSFRSALFDKKTSGLSNVVRQKTPNFLAHPNMSIDDLQKLLILKIGDVINHYVKLDSKIETIAISFPGPIMENGVVHQACTIWGDKGKKYPLKDILEESYPTYRFVIANDISAATERYARLNQNTKHDFISVITISSGIGSKVFDLKNNKLLLDRNGIGGEMGHIKVKYDNNAPKCDCGGIGHLGAIASGRGVQRLIIERSLDDFTNYRNSRLYWQVRNPVNLDNRHIVDSIKMNDKFTQNILDETTFYITQCISHISANLGVDKFIFIGGFALNCGDAYLNSLRRSLKKHDFFNRNPETISQLVTLGINDDNDCLIGIGLHAIKILDEK
jgi:glucokinase